MLSQGTPTWEPPSCLSQIGVSFSKYVLLKKERKKKECSHNVTEQSNLISGYLIKTEDIGPQKLHHIICNCWKSRYHQLLFLRHSVQLGPKSYLSLCDPQRACSTFYFLMSVILALNLSKFVIYLHVSSLSGPLLHHLIFLKLSFEMKT